MKHRDDADYYRVHKRCYECQLYFESELKQKGLAEMERLDQESGNFAEGATPHSFVIG